MDRRYMKLSLIFVPMIVYLSIMFRVIDNFCEETDISTDETVHSTAVLKNTKPDTNMSRYLQSLVKKYDELEQEKVYLLSLIKSLLGRNTLSQDKNNFMNELDKMVHPRIIKAQKPKSDWSSTETNIVKPKYLFNCTNINKISLKQKIGHGVSKQAFLGIYHGQEIAVKMVTRHQKDVRNCLQKLSDEDIVKRHECFMFPNMKLMKEILLLEQMDHPGFIKLLGYCVRSEETDSTDLSEHGVTAVYEYGKRLNVANLQFNTFGSRLQHAIDLADFLSYLDNSPLGSLRVRDFKETHFLLVNSSIKMIDLDDVDNLEPSCDIYYDTQDTEYGNETKARSTTCEFDLPCYMGLCIGSNAKNNLKMMNKLFLSRLLHPKLFPSSVSEKVSDLLARIDTSNISAAVLVQQLSNIQKILFSVYGH
ncbi:PKDCC [Mytilus coruscus]|uniref:PKDCC n=1 Tax=Mytilus coruscus TaxID=42192 RepID=A0A6J8E345_MYTCO|nr:PKDCC [Mytilus coruscus]